MSLSRQRHRYWDIRELINEFPDCQYYVVFGERSNGKTYSSLDYALDEYIQHGSQFAYIRRFDVEIRPKQLTELWSGHIQNKAVTIKTDNKFDTISYYNRKFYIGKTDPQDMHVERCQEPMGFAFDIAGMEHYKSLSFPKIRTIIFDEFLSRSGYLPNEFVLFSNVLSTIIRDRDDVKIIMLGNTVNKFCPYFREMGLKNIDKLTPGKRQIYVYGQPNSDGKLLKVAVEMTESTTKTGGKPSDVYFAFDNPRLQMITSGSWEIAAYPRVTRKYSKKDIFFTCFVSFEKALVKLDCIANNDGYFIVASPKTTELKEPDKDLVYTDYPDQRQNYRMCLTKQSDRISMFIRRCIAENKVFYATNETGEIMRNYLMWSDTYNIKNA